MDPAIWICIIGIAMAAIGVEMSIDNERTKKYRWLYRIAFVSLALVLVIFTVKQSNDNQNQVESLKSSLSSVKVEDAETRGYLKGRIDDLAAMLRHGDPGLEKFAAAISSSTRQFIGHESEILKRERRQINNQNLKSQAIEVAKKLRQLQAHMTQSENELEGSMEEAQRKLFMSPNLSNDQKKQQVAKQNQKYVHEMLDLNSRFRYQFQSQLQGEASNVELALLSRLHLSRPNKGEDAFADHVINDGVMAGPTPFNNAAAYIEKLARELSP